MNLRFIIPVFIILGFTNLAKAQKASSDSVGVAASLNELLRICRSVDFADPKVTSLGTFYKAAPYIIYHGDDKKRSWKDFANYSKADEKTGVDNVCERINRTANQDSAYKIIKYFTETESEGTWHVLVLTYKKKDAERTTKYAFLKIGNKFGLGDID